MILLVRLVRTNISLEIKHFIGDRVPVVVELEAEDNLSVVSRKFWEQLGKGYIYTEQRLYVYKVIKILFYFCIFLFDELYINCIFLGFTILFKIFCY